MIELFTDGAAQGNPGKGGYGIILRSGNHYKEISQGYKLTTNNRMELIAVIVGLEQLKKNGSNVTVFSDSKYVVDAVAQGWLLNWKKKGFKKIKNVDLWLRFDAVFQKHKVKMKWIKGHAGHAENERCDELAVQAAMGANLLTDEGYIKSLDNSDETLF